MKILIVDDEHLARERLKQLIQQFPAYEVVGEAANGRDAIRMSRELEADVVLLDIRMPGIDGLEVARQLIQQDVPPAIIFTTAFSDYALAAFDTGACAYLLKPIKKDKLGDALRHARQLSKAQLEALQQTLSHEKPKSERSHIVATTRDGNVRIPIDDILYFQADQKYTTVYHTQGEVLIEESLKHLEDDLVPAFFRIHRKFLVNSAYIVGLEKADNLGLHGAQLALKHTDEKIPVSRRRLAEVRRLLFKDPSH